MRKSNSHSGLIAKRSNRLLAAVLTAIALCLASCQTTTVIPIDDVYYWDKHEQNTPTTQTAPNDPKDPKGPKDPKASTAPKASLEYLNVQDTTITVRIKK